MKSTVPKPRFLRTVSPNDAALGSSAANGPENACTTAGTPPTNAPLGDRSSVMTKSSRASSTGSPSEVATTSIGLIPDGPKKKPSWLTTVTEAVTGVALRLSKISR